MRVAGLSCRVARPIAEPLTIPNSAPESLIRPDCAHLRDHGYPVVYSSSMADLPTSTTSGVTPILFGSFSDGYVIGDRGGSGTFVKILDQPLAQYGQTVLLGYKRVDGKVRLAEAVQEISISHS